MVSVHREGKCSWHRSANFLIWEEEQGLRGHGESSLCRMFDVKGLYRRSNPVTSGGTYSVQTCEATTQARIGTVEVTVPGSHLVPGFELHLKRLDCSS